MVAQTAPRAPTQGNHLNSLSQLFVGITGSLLWGMGGALAAVFIVGRLDGGWQDNYDWKNVLVSEAGLSRFAFILVVGVTLLIVWSAVRPHLSVGGDSVSAVTAAATGFLVFLLLSLLTLSVKPSPLRNASDERHIVPVYPSIDTDPILTYSVFFPNDSAVLSKEQTTALTAFMEPLSQCQGLELVVRGFASAAQYPSDNGVKNLKLIQRRLAAVQIIAEKTSMKVAPAEPWPNLEAMAASRLIDDGNGIPRQPMREGLNRRVELRVANLGQCSVKVAAAPGPPAQTTRLTPK